MRTLHPSWTTIRRAVLALTVSAAALLATAPAALAQDDRRDNEQHRQELRPQTQDDGIQLTWSSGGLVPTPAADELGGPQPVTPGPGAPYGSVDPSAGPQARPMRIDGFLKVPDIPGASNSATDPGEAAVIELGSPG